MKEQTNFQFQNNNAYHCAKLYFRKKKAHSQKLNNHFEVILFEE
jgi:hypothetical protein